MKKIILFLILCVSALFGFEYDNILLQTQATIYPKIILLDKKLPHKLINNEIVYTIICETGDYQTALKVKKMINQTFHHYLGNYVYQVKIVKCTDFSTLKKTTAIYVLSPCENIKEIATFAKKRGIISFAYDFNDLKKGLLISLNIEREIVFYLNKDVLNREKIELVDSFLQMVQFF